MSHLLKLASEQLFSFIIPNTFSTVDILAC